MQSGTKLSPSASGNRGDHYGLLDKSPTSAKARAPPPSPSRTLKRAVGVFSVLLAVCCSFLVYDLARQAPGHGNSQLEAHGFSVYGDGHRGLRGLESDASADADSTDQSSTASTTDSSTAFSSTSEAVSKKDGYTIPAVHWEPANLCANLRNVTVMWLTRPDDYGLKERNMWRRFMSEWMEPHGYDVSHFFVMGKNFNVTDEELRREGLVGAIVGEEGKEGNEEKREKARKKREAEKLRTLMDEAVAYQDIIVADYEDRYDRLSDKTFVGISWFARCPQGDILAKSDGDVVVNWRTFFEEYRGDKRDFWQLDSVREEMNDMKRHPEAEQPYRLTRADEKRVFNVNSPHVMGSEMRFSSVLHDGLHKNSEPEVTEFSYYPPYASGHTYFMNKLATRVYTDARRADPRHFVNEDAMLGIFNYKHKIRVSNHDDMMHYNENEFLQHSCKNKEAAFFKNCGCHANWLTLHCGSDNSHNCRENALFRVMYPDEDQHCDQVIDTDNFSAPPFRVDEPNPAVE